MMATAVGRGRSRGIRGTRPPGVSTPPSINSQPGTPVASPPPPAPATVDPTFSTPAPAAVSAAVPAAANPFVADPVPAVNNTPTQQTPQDIATSCLNVLRNPKRRNQSECYRDCIEMLSNCLGAPENSAIWVEKCIQDVYGDIPLTQEFVQLISTIQTDKTLQNYKEMVAATLRSMSKEMDRLKPENPSAMSEAQGEAFAFFTVLLAEVALHIKKHNGQPLPSLTVVLFKDCLHVLAQPGFPDQVYKVIHHVLVRYGRTLEEHLHSVLLQKTTPEEIARELEELYDKVRGIIIHDSTSDKSRLLLLEVVERRAHQYNMPEECLQYYKSA